MRDLMCKNKTYFFWKGLYLNSITFILKILIFWKMYLSLCYVYLYVCVMFLWLILHPVIFWLTYGFMDPWNVCACVMKLMQKYFCFSVPIFKVEAVRTLVLDDRQTCLLGDSKWQCTRLSWYKGKGHRCNNHHTYLSLKLCRFLTFKGIVYCNTTFIVYMNTCLLIILC
jgi:hypothetical protein